jgi:hypothetical protein
MTSDRVAVAITISVLSLGIRALKTPDHATSQPVPILELPKHYPFIFEFIGDFYAVLIQK